MKNCSVNESCLGLDRLATWDEIRSAMASQGASEPGYASGGHGDVESDSAGSVEVVSEKLAWLEILKEGVNRKSN